MWNLMKKSGSSRKRSVTPDARSALESPKSRQQTRTKSPSKVAMVESGGGKTSKISSVEKSPNKKKRTSGSIVEPVDETPKSTSKSGSKEKEIDRANAKDMLEGLLSKKSSKSSKRTTKGNDVSFPTGKSMMAKVKKGSKRDSGPSKGAHTGSQSPSVHPALASQMKSEQAALAEALKGISCTPVSTNKNNNGLMFFRGRPFWLSDDEDAEDDTEDSVPITAPSILQYVETSVNQKEDDEKFDKLMNVEHDPFAKTPRLKKCDELFSSLNIFKLTARAVLASMPKNGVTQDESRMVKPDDHKKSKKTLKFKEPTEELRYERDVIIIRKLKDGKAKKIPFERDTGSSKEDTNPM